MSAREEAQHFLDQLRAGEYAKRGTLPRRIDPAAAKDFANRFLHDCFIPEQGQDPMPLS